MLIVYCVERPSEGSATVVMQVFVKLVQVDMLLLMTSSATGTGMLVKKELTLNDTNASSSGLNKSTKFKNTSTPQIHTSNSP